MKRMAMEISGIVQGVGFRPFIYHLAKDLSLAGWVCNTSAGVTLEVEGSEQALQAFVRAVREQAPPLARVDEIKTSLLPVKGETAFVIEASQQEGEGASWVAPDAAMCPACRRELFNIQDRRYGYPFLNCTHCGPRYTLVRHTPYDRKNTTMAAFTQCPACQAEYDDPSNRRFHAQPNACPVCGPHYQLVDKTGMPVKGEPLQETRKRIEQGCIVAVKGIGGYHLACCAKKPQTVKELRLRKGREAKPFAVMCAGIEEARRLCRISKAEEELLTSVSRPIVLLEKQDFCDVAEEVAPDNKDLGVMLPYAPVHELLLKDGDVWVMTSGNPSEDPIYYQEEAALKGLAPMADYFLIHNREICRPVDDSVMGVFDGKPYMIRRSRGFAPLPVPLPEGFPSLLAVGGQLKNTFCLTRGHQAFLSHHIGNLESLDTYQYYTREIQRYQELFAVTPEAVAYDLHPGYASTRYAGELNLPGEAVQHHHAHIASVMAEHRLEEPVIGVAFDGTGYGEDGCLWGGEFLLCEYHQYTRLAHCRYLPLPGGEKAVKEPWRMALWVLYNKYGDELLQWPLSFLKELPENWRLLMDAAGKGLNSPLTSSAGRLFDLAAVLLGYTGPVRYEGQAAVWLEQLAWKEKDKGTLLPYEILEEDVLKLDFVPAFDRMLQELVKGMTPGSLAESFHLTIAQAVCQTAERISRSTGVKKVALSGGVWQNRNLLLKVVRMLQMVSLEPYVHQWIPPNDGGLAFGQAMVAGKRLLMGQK